MHLSDMDKKKLILLNNRLKSILLQQMASPHNFENHVRCLIELQVFYDNCFLMMSKYKPAEKSQGKRRFNRLFVSHVEKKSFAGYQKIVEECQAILFDNRYFELKHKAFSSQPVAGMDVYYGLDRNEQGLRWGIFLGSTSEIIYELQFSDGTAIHWSDMNDKQQLKSAKMYFEQKMQQVRKNHDHDNDLISDDDDNNETCLIL